MKDQYFRFSRPIKILQVFTNILRYGKDEMSYDKRRHLLEWNPLFSLHGYVYEETLYLPGAILEHKDIGPCNLVTIKDSLHAVSPYIENMEPNACFELSAPRKLGMFRLKQAETLELHLDWSNTHLDPSRDNIKLANLLPGQPVEIAVNGKMDYKERSFFDHQYIFEYLGDFKTCIILKEDAKPFLKPIPAERKRVDLLKPLW